MWRDAVREPLLSRPLACGARPKMSASSANVQSRDKRRVESATGGRDEIDTLARKLIDVPSLFWT